MLVWGSLVVWQMVVSMLVALCSVAAPNAGSVIVSGIFCFMGKRANDYGTYARFSALAV